MKYTYFLFAACLLCLFTACEPHFNLNAPRKDVTVVYGILNHQDSIHYVKIYRGFQPHGQNSVWLDAQNPDSIYYNPAHINVVLLEYLDEKRTHRPNIKLEPTHDFPRDTGIFYYGDEKNIYYTKEPIHKGMVYKIVITNLLTGIVTDGQTSIVEDFEIKNNMIDMTVAKTAAVAFTKAGYASGYEIHVSFIYFEVDKKTHQVVGSGKITKNITPTLGENFQSDGVGDLRKVFPMTFLDDINAQVKVNPDVIRFVGTPTISSAFEIEGWAAGESMVKFLLSNQPVGSFTQVNILYTNMKASEDGVAFGFLSSKVKAPTQYFNINDASENKLVREYSHLGFRPYVEWIQMNNE